MRYRWLIGMALVGAVAVALRGQPDVRRPVLPDRVASQVEQIEADIDAAQAAYLNGDRASLDGAIEQAQRVLALRLEHQADWHHPSGEAVEWYEIGDARRRIERLKRIHGLSPAECARLATMEPRANEAIDAFEEGAYEQGLAAMSEAYDIATDVLGPNDPDTIVVALNLAVLLDAVGELDAAESLYRDTLEAATQALGSLHPDTVSVAGNLGVLLESRGRLVEAERYFVVALEGSRILFGDDHPSTLSALGNMGYLLKSQGRLEEAAPLYRQVLTQKRAILGDDDPSTLTSIANMAGLLEDQGRHAEAETLSREVVERSRRVLGEDHPDTLTYIGGLGVGLQKQGRLSEAEPFFRAALEGKRRVHGDTHPSTLVAIGNMGFLLAQQGRLSEAEPFYQQALDGKVAVLGERHPSTVTAIENLGVLRSRQGRLDEAEVLVRRALALMREILGPEHPRTVSMLNNLGSILEDRGEIAEAEMCFRDEIAMSRRILGDDHPDVMVSMNNLGLLLLSTGRYAEAEPYLRESLEGSRAAMGADHPDTLTMMSNVAEVCRRHGDLNEAERLHRDALERRRRVLGADHPATLDSIQHLGYLHRSAGAFDRAEPFYRDALAGRRRVLGDDHFKTLISVHELASLLRETHAFAEAEQLVGEAVERRRRVLGDDHVSTLESIRLLAEIHRAQGRWPAAEAAYREALSIALSLRGAATGDERGRAAMADALALRDIVTGFTMALVKRGAYAEAWTVTEQGRSRALLDLLARSEADLAAGLSDAQPLVAARVAERDAYARLREAEAVLAALEEERAAVEANSSLDPDERDQRCRAFDEILETQHDALLRARRDHGEASARINLHLRAVMPDAQPLTIDTIQARLEPDDLMLGYTWSGRDVMLLTLTADSSSGMVLARSTEDVETLEAHVHELRDVLAWRPGGGVDRRWPVDAGSRVTSEVLPPAVVPLLAEATRLVILPDGPLADIPFEVLLPEDAHQQIVYASSATVYLNRYDAARRKTWDQATPAVAIGDPVFEVDRVRSGEPEYPSAGVLAMRVVENSNAAKAGLARGDVILAYGGEEVRDLDHVLAIKTQRSAEVDAGQRAADDPMPVRVWRKGEVIETTMTPGPMGLQLAPGDPAETLRAMAQMSRGMEERIAEASLLDVVRLHGGTLPRLPGTRIEVERIGEVLGAHATVLLGEDATLANLESSVDGVRYLHIATHGLVGSQDRPYDASLALTRPTTPTVDDIGFLTLDRLIRHWQGKLDACDLVTLSACDTQRGVRQGDALMSLPWGFYYAGAPTVVASLWQIDDEATALLMARFYENLLGSHKDERRIRDVAYADGESMPKADALQEAKHWLRNYEVQARGVGRGPVIARGQGPRTRRPYEHPYYWAAFVLIGDPGENVFAGSP